MGKSPEIGTYPGRHPTIGSGHKKTPQNLEFSGVSGSEADGARTRNLRRDRPMLKAIEADTFLLTKSSFLERARAEDRAWINWNDSPSRTNVAEDLVNFAR